MVSQSFLEPIRMPTRGVVVMDASRVSARMNEKRRDAEEDFLLPCIPFILAHLF
jgi:hypothetical protein